MADSVYLSYTNKSGDTEAFEYTNDIPQLWVELLDELLIERQERKIVHSFYDEESEEPLFLEVSKGDAIRNLKLRFSETPQENSDVNLLRADFLKFIEDDVADQSNLEISIDGLMWFTENPLLFFRELKNSISGDTLDLSENKTAVSFQAIGFNESFRKHSKVYQQLHASLTLENDQQATQRSAADSLLKKKVRRSKVGNAIVMSLIATSLAFFGFFGLLKKNELGFGFLLLFLALILYLFVYFKYIKKWT